MCVLEVLTKIGTITGESFRVLLSFRGHNMLAWLSGVPKSLRVLLAPHNQCATLHLFTHPPDERTSDFNNGAVLRSIAD